MAVSSIGDRLKAVRKAVNLSQRGFCKGIFTSQSFYGQIESGAKNGNERIYELICNKYKVNKVWLITGKGEMFSETPPDVELEQLIEIIRELDPLFKDYIIQQIKNLAKLHRQSKGKGQEAPRKEPNPAPKGRKPR
jgi:transcriptional regulator with XRE-family HTH domain